MGNGVFAVDFAGVLRVGAHLSGQGVGRQLGVLGVPVSALRCLPPVPSCAMDGKLKSSAKSLVKSHETSEISIFKNSVLK